MGPKPTLGEKNEEMLVKWISGLAARGFPIAICNLVSSVEKIAKDLKCDRFLRGRPGKKWVKLFLRRHPEIAERTVEKLSNARASLTESAIRRCFEEVQSSLENTEVIKNPVSIFNMDESGFQLCPKGEKVLAIKGQKNVYEHSGNEKESVTVLIAVSAVGRIAPSLVVYPGKRLPKGLGENLPENVEWSFAKSDKGWITGKVFYEYIANVFHPWLLNQKIPRPVIVFLDGHSSHLTYHLSKFCIEAEIIVIALHPNATHILQPLDVAVFGPLKKYWAKKVRTWRLENGIVSIDKLHLPQLLDDLLIKNLTESTIVNGFRACGLSPWNPDAVDYTKCNANESYHQQSVSTVIGHNESKKSNHKYVEDLIGSDLIASFEAKNVNVIADNFDLYNLWKRSEAASIDVQPSNPLASGISSNENENDILPPQAPNENEDEHLQQPSIPSNVEGNEVPSSQPSTLEMVISPGTGGKNVPSPFKKHLLWPGTPKKKVSARRNLQLPAVVTSKQWIDFEEKRRNKKKREEEEKEERKRKREEAKLIKENKQKYL